MAELSPKAEAIWEAFNEEEAGVFVDYGDKLAAAIKRLAEEVILPKYAYAEWELAHSIHNEILSIAAELEGTND